MLMNPCSSSFGLENKLCGNVYGIESQNEVITGTSYSFTLLIIEVGTQWPLSSNFSAATSQGNIILLYLFSSINKIKVGK